MDKLMKGKKGIVMGVLNDHSIASGIAKSLSDHGADIALTYQNESLLNRVEKVGKKLNSNIFIQCDVTDKSNIEQAFEELKNKWTKIDFVVHSLAFSDRNELQGKYIDTTRENFLNTMLISCFSFTEITKAASKILNENGSLLTLTYLGSSRALPNYNVMGVAKAALESSVRYLASDLGPQGIRVNALSPGPMRTAAAAGIGGARALFDWARNNSLLKRDLTLENVGNAGLYLISNLSAGVTGEIHYVDCGYNVLGMPFENKDKK